MSAIAGIIWFHGAPAQRDDIEGLVARSASYGPDEQTTWCEGSVALGHCMLRTTPEATDEHLPLLSADGRYCLVWDGRLDNRAELSRSLLASGMQPRGDTDSELVLQSYMAWGRGCCDRLAGDFAFAVWDAREKRLFCIRDHVGARPLYWTRTNQFFAFASHEEALLGLPGVTTRRYQSGIARIFVDGLRLPEDREANVSRTWYEDVRFVRAGQLAEIDPDGQVQLQVYWEPLPGEERQYTCDQECEEAFVEVFGTATRHRLRATGDVAILLSGGLDSAGIVAMARRLLRQSPDKHLHAYSVVADDPQTCVETRCILSMAEGMGDRFHSLKVPSMSGLAHIDDLRAQAWDRSHPEDDALWLQALLFQAASQNGHRVILQGVHGDLATWAPDRYIADFMRAGWLRHAWRECRAASRNHNALRGRPAWRLLAENAWTAWVPAAVRSWVHATKAQPPAVDLLRPDFLHSLGWSRKQHTDTNRAERQYRPASRLHAQVLKSLTYSRSGIPRVAGRFGVETRDPWEDRQVIEFFLSLPTRFKVRNGWTKHLVRTSFRNDLDAQVRWRVGKEHLGWQLGERMLRECEGQIRAILDDSADVCWQYLDSAAAARNYQRHLSHHDHQSALNLFNMMTLSSWMRRVR
jgi:asparagine synthase (glutamine-hydrolysing)